MTYIVYFKCAIHFITIIIMTELLWNGIIIILKVYFVCQQLNNVIVYSYMIIFIVLPSTCFHSVFLSVLNQPVCLLSVSGIEEDFLLGLKIWKAFDMESYSCGELTGNVTNTLWWCWWDINNMLMKYSELQNAFCNCRNGDHKWQNKSDSDNVNNH